MHTFQSHTELWNCASCTVLTSGFAIACMSSWIWWFQVMQQSHLQFIHMLFFSKVVCYKDIIVKSQKTLYFARCHLDLSSQAYQLHLLVTPYQLLKSHCWMELAYRGVYWYKTSVFYEDCSACKPMFIPLVLFQFGCFTLSVKAFKQFMLKVYLSIYWSNNIICESCETLQCCFS